jgi:Cu/Ag efflux pump CusA
MFGQGISSNIMSLGGIAIAIGAMVDAVIIMVENAHKHMELEQGKKPHWEIIRDSSVEVGPTLFYSLLVITVSSCLSSCWKSSPADCSSRSPLPKPIPWLQPQSFP